ncbi:unnamed protein product, partial [Amoebophrya sp. A25]
QDHDDSRRDRSSSASSSRNIRSPPAPFPNTLLKYDAANRVGLDKILTIPALNLINTTSSASRAGSKNKITSLSEAQGGTASIVDGRRESVGVKKTGFADAATVQVTSSPGLESRSVSVLPARKMEALSRDVSLSTLSQMLLQNTSVKRG